MTVLVSLTPEHVQAVHDARAKLVCLAALGVNVELTVDLLGDILDICRRERLHSVDYRRVETIRQVAEDGVRLMSGAFRCDPDESCGYDTSDQKHPDYHDRMSAVYDLRDRGER